MATEYSQPINRLVEAFRKLPGVGPRTARRMTWHVAESPYEEAVELARALVGVKKSIKPCPVCFNYTDAAPCPICADAGRDKGFVCVVETPEDVAALERAGGHRGVYHVLGGTINPIKGAGPDSIRAAELVKRVEAGGIREVLVATNPSTEGEITALYLTKLLSKTGVRMTRPARGLPAGADIDLLDNDTIIHALSSRQDISVAPAEEKNDAAKKSEK